MHLIPREVNYRCQWYFSGDTLRVLAWRPLYQFPSPRRELTSFLSFSYSTCVHTGCPVSRFVLNEKRIGSLAHLIFQWRGKILYNNININIDIILMITIQFFNILIIWTFSNLYDFFLFQFIFVNQDFCLIIRIRPNIWNMLNRPIVKYSFSFILLFLL